MARRPSTNWHSEIAAAPCVVLQQAWQHQREQSVQQRIGHRDQQRVLVRVMTEAGGVAHPGAQGDFGDGDVVEVLSSDKASTARASASRVSTTRASASDLRPVVGVPCVNARPS